MNEEKLKEDSKRFIKKTIDKGYMKYTGAELDSILPLTSRRQGAREAKKLNVLEKSERLLRLLWGLVRSGKFYIQSTSSV